MVRPLTSGSNVIAQTTDLISELARFAIPMTPTSAATTAPHSVRRTLRAAGNLGALLLALQAGGNEGAKAESGLSPCGFYLPRRFRKIQAHPRTCRRFRSKLSAR